MIRAGESARYLLCGAFVGIAFFQLTQSGVDVTISHFLSWPLRIAYFLLFFLRGKI